MSRIAVGKQECEMSPEDIPGFIVEISVKAHGAARKNLARCKSVNSAAQRLSKNLIEFASKVVTQLAANEEAALLAYLREVQGPEEWASVKEHIEAKRQKTKCTAVETIVAWTIAAEPDKAKEVAEEWRQFENNWQQKILRDEVVFRLHVALIDHV